jgi:predicted DNA-binding transcriptional regulator YafY
VAHAVKDRMWHPGQKVEKGKDGSVIVSFEAGGVMEIVSWVLSYGNNAEILEPRELRMEVIGIINEMAELYR